MKISGFTCIRNAIKNDYPILEAIQSILSICDEFIIAVGQSEDGTLGLIQSIDSKKIKIIETVWDDTLRAGGRAFALETDKAYQAISADTDWAFYIQGDECVHEHDLPIIKQAMDAYFGDRQVEALLFKYIHFYGSYNYYATSRRWYRHEIRALKFNRNVRSYRDAQGFRKNDRKIKVKPVEAYIYHYGWVKTSKGLANKVYNFNQFYHDQQWIEANLPKDLQFDYGNADVLKKFDGTHPAVMQKRIEAMHWTFDVDPILFKKNTTFRRRFLQKIEDWTGWRIGEYKNYELI